MKYKTLPCVARMRAEKRGARGGGQIPPYKPGLQTWHIKKMKRTGNISINISIGDVQSAARRAFKGHRGKEDVREFLRDFESSCRKLHAALLDGSWRQYLSYRDTELTGSNGKKRRIDVPSLETRIYQHLMLELLEPVYGRKDPMVGLNCKKGCGITASSNGRGALRRAKHLFYDLRGLRYALVIDQRKCYAHVTEKVFRRELKRLVCDPWMVDFSVGVSFVGGRLPIGTPSSPFVHHVVMLGFDLWLSSLSPFRLRYADDCLLAFATREEAQAAKWRVKNWWWYVLGMRAKRHRTSVVPLSLPMDYCGFVLHRSAHVAKPFGHTDKGHATIRRGTAERAKRCRMGGSWASYFGLMKHGDCYGLMRKIEKDMKLRELTMKIRIDRKMDARHVDVRDLCGKTFTIHDYEVRRSSQGDANWIKCLVGVEEMGDDGSPTGRMLAYEFHGNYQGIIQFILACEAEFGKKSLLPMEDMEIENQCGYIFKGSTNQFKYIEDYEGIIELR